MLIGTSDIWMARDKLILICQSGGEFVKNDDGSLTYAGGEAHAVNVNCETLLDDLKLKLAEMCNLELKTVSVKYFLPGNTRTLIFIANDKDLKRMLNYHGNSVTAEVFVTGTEGFNHDALNTCTRRETGIKVAESVNHVVTLAPTTVAATSSPVDAASPAGTPPIAIAPTAAVTTSSAVDAAGPVGSPPARRARVATRRTVVRKKATPAVRKKATPAAIRKATDSVDTRRSARAKPASKASANANNDNSCGAPLSPIIHAAKEEAHSSIDIDMSASPADTVKKRRRTAAWKVGASGPTIVAVPDDGIGGEKRSRKSNSRNLVAHDGAGNDDGISGDKRPRKRNSRNLVMHDSVGHKKDLHTSHLTYTDDVALEELVASWKDGITGIGQDFKNVGEFRDALQKYAVAHRFVYLLKKNESSRVSAKCASDGCSWRIHASWVPASQSFRIKTLIDSHTCGGESWKSAHPAKKWLVNIIKDRLRDAPNHKPKDLANRILQDFGIELNYTQVWRGIGDAREQLQGSYKKAYNQLSWYREKIIETNPGSFAKLVIGDDKRFECLFVSFHASIHGFQKGCRPLLFLETTSLKSKYQGVLLTATAVDGEDRFFPVAFAMVDSESNDKWQWFLDQLKSALPTSGSITFVSDRDLGLKDSVLKVFEDAYLGYSMYHLLKSFKKSLKPPFRGDGKGSLPGFFLAAAHAVRRFRFDKFAEQIKRVSSQAYDWVMQIEPEYWTSTSYKGERHNQITENVSESYSKLMEKARELPITQKVDALIRMMAELINTRQTDSRSWSTKLTPSKEAKLEEEMVDALGLKVLFSSDTLFEVHDDAIHVVNLDNWDCTCLGWKTTGLPCRHAIAVFNCTNRNVYDYCSKYFTVDSFRLTYSDSISPVSGIDKPAEKEDTTSDTLCVLPPYSSRSSSNQKRDQDRPTATVVIALAARKPGMENASDKPVS